MIQPTKTRIQATDYYQHPDYEEHDFIQLINGEVVIDMPPILKHQAIVRELLLLLGLIARNTGGTAFTAPTEVYLDVHNVYEPEVLYLTPDTGCRMEEKRIVGAPELVVEVLSPSTAKYDRQEKYQAYEKYGVSEYWIVDPVHEVVEVWQLESKQFNRVGAFANNDVFESRPLGEVVNIKDIFNIK